MRILIFSFIFSFLFATPKWFYSLDNNKSNYYIGYGEGKTIKEAKNNALNDISSQIEIKIKSEFESNVNNYKKNISQKLNLSTNANLTDYKVLKVENKDNKYYVAIGYENIPNIDKFIKKLPKNSKTSNNKFLNNTYLGKYIKEKIGKFIKFHIFNKDNKWYIAYGNKIQILDKEIFDKLYISMGEIKTNHKYNIFHNDDIIKVYIKVPFSGYVTLFDVNDKGEVYILMINKVKKGWNEIKSSDFDLKAYTDKKEEKEMYVAVFTKNKPNFTQFSTILDTNNNRDFGILINTLKNYKFATLKIITKGE